MARLTQIEPKGLYLSILNEFRDIIQFHAQADVVLVSGSLAFCMNYVHKSETPVLAVIHNSSRLNSALKRENFKTSSHLMVGGATSFRLCYYLSEGLKSPQYTSVRRTIKSFLEFGIRGFNTCPCATHLLPKDRLPIGDISSYIKLQDSWNPNQTIYRKLTINELGYIFGVPRKWHKFLSSHNFNQLIPVQVLDALLQPNLKEIRKAPEQRPLSLPTFPWDPQGTYLPQLKAYLPHVWYKVQDYKDHVAKHGDAQACMSFWDGRIANVLHPKATNIYNTLRSFCLRIYRQKLFTEFLTFYNSKESRMTALGFLKQQGGKRWIFLQQSSNNYQSLISSTLHEIKLKGIDAISRAINSTSFMDWSEGSSLFFWRWPLDLRIIAC